MLNILTLIDAFVAKTVPAETDRMLVSVEKQCPVRVPDILLKNLKFFTVMLMDKAVYKRRTKSFGKGEQWLKWTYV